MFNPEIFGRAAAELMTLRLGEVTKAHADIVARVAALEKALQETEKENAKLKSSLEVLARGCDSMRDDIDGAIHAVESLPEPGKGEKGDTGERGEKGDTGAAGRDGVGITDAIIDAEGKLVLTFSDGRIKELGIVVGRDGKDGEKGETGAQGAAGEKGVRGEKGERGDSVRDAIIDNTGNLILTFTDGSTKSLGRVVGESFSDFTMEYLPDTHEIAMRATCAGVTKSLHYPAGGIRALGYWREGKAAKAGEAVSLGGCLYIARKDTKAKPTYDHPDWFLAVQRGRDMTADTKNIQRNAEKPVQLIPAEGEK